MSDLDSQGIPTATRKESDIKPQESPLFPKAAQCLTSHETDEYSVTLSKQPTPVIPPGIPSLDYVYRQFPMNRVIPMHLMSGSPQLYFSRTHQSDCQKHGITVPPYAILSQPPECNLSQAVETKQAHQSTGPVSSPYLNHQKQDPHDGKPDFEHETSKSSTTNTRLNSPITTNPQLTASRWHSAQSYRFQVYEPPQIDPSADNTLPLVLQNAEYWVTELTQALTNTGSVKDTPSSHALRMFLPTFCDPLLIEATARQIFTFLLDRCMHGFRGPAAFNKALKPVRDLEADRFANCEERLRNVIEVLKWNKRVCKDVLYEDWKIRLLVNHPLGYDKDKDCQKGSNDQRRKRLKEERDKLKGAQEELKTIKMVEGDAKRRRLVGEVKGKE